MAVKIESTIFVTRPAEEVFRFVLDLERSARLMDPGVESVVKTPDGPVGVGTMFRLRQYTMGKLRETTSQITGIELDRRIDFDARLGPVSARFSITFEPAAAGTRVAVLGEGRPIGLLKLMSRKMQRMGQRAWDERLARLKTVLETRRI